MHRGIVGITLPAAVAMVALFTPWAVAQSPSPTGIRTDIEGRVTDGATGEALPGVRLTIPGSATRDLHGSSGGVRLTGVPAGQQTILVSYLGRRDETVDVEVIAGSTRRLDVSMGTNRFEESVTVSAELISDAQARASISRRTRRISPTSSPPT